MTYTGFVSTFYSRVYPHQRKGQALFNYLFLVRPDLANAIQGSDLDPFYSDERIPACLSWLAQDWGPHENQ